jgi:AcrR family transcriptional regulator
LDQTCKIKEVASKLFMKLGFKSVTMDDISKEMGMSKKTLYKSYSNKRELIKTCVLDYKETIFEEMEQIKKEDNNPIEELFRLESFFDNAIFDTELSPSFQLKKYYPEVFQEIHCTLDGDFDQFMHNNILKGQAEGFYMNDLDVELAKMFHKTLRMNGEAEQMAEEKERHYAILKYHIRAIATEKGRTELNNQLNKLYGQH